MIKQLPLVIFCQHDQWFALDASFVLGQGQTAYLDTSSAQLLSFDQLLAPNHLMTNHSVTHSPAHWLRLAGSLSLANSVNPLLKSQGAWLLGIAAAAELVEMPVEQIHALPPLLQASREFKALQAVAWHQQRLVSLIDARVLLRLAVPLLTPATPDVNQVESLPNPAS